MKLPIVITPKWVKPAGQNKRGPTPLGPKRKYPFHKLEVGQSFLASYKLRDKLAPLAVYHGKRLGRQFVVVRLESDPYTIAICRVA
jgi:hypothetical protein